MSVPVLECAFRTQRVLVDGSPVEPSHSLTLGQTWEMVFHRHETEVHVATSQPLPHIVVGVDLHLETCAGGDLKLRNFGWAQLIYALTEHLTTEK